MAGCDSITASLFVFLTTELMPIGLLTPLSESLGVSVGSAGLRGSFVVGGLIMIAALVMLLTVGANDIGVIAAMVLWGLAFGVVQLSQINMTLSAAPETFEPAMSLNTMAYNTCIALGALISVLFADHVGVTSVIWFGIVLVALAVILRASTGRRTTPTSRPLRMTYDV